MSTKTKARPTWTKEHIPVLVGVHSPGRDDRREVRPIEAETWSWFAVHKPVEDWIAGWSVTHIPSGYNVLYSATSKASAKAFCVEVAGLTDWETLAADNARERWPAMKEQMLAAALKARS